MTTSPGSRPPTVHQPSVRATEEAAVMDPTTDVIAQIVSRASSPGYEAWWAEVAHAGYCSSPVELRGRDAHGRSVKILTRCKNRRASVCPSCSALYSGDTWQLVHQGIR